MKQSKLASFIEQCLNTASGFVLSLTAQAFVLPALGVAIEFKQNVAFALVMTAISVARGYGWRRLMEALHVRRPLSPFITAAIEERFRQIEKEGWTAEHDDAEHKPGELALAGSCYAAHWIKKNSAPSGVLTGNVLAPQDWPWNREWWKPHDFRRDLVRAAALILAEGEKFDRQRKDKP